MCNHGSGTVEDYARAAVASQLEILGFSEHSPFPDNAYDSSRMRFSQLGDYCSAVRNAGEQFPELTIWAGLEIDLRNDLSLAFYEDTYRGEYHLDYLIGGVHFYETDSGIVSPVGGKNGRELSTDQVRLFIEKSIRLMQSGLIDYLAHPDMPAMAFVDWTAEHDAIFKDLIEAAVSLDIPLEINGNGMRRPLKQLSDGGCRYCYPVRRFWELAAENGARAVFGSDAHHPEQVWDHYSEACALADDLGIQLANSQLAEQIASRTATGTCLT